MNDPIEIISSKISNTLKRWDPDLPYHVEEIRFGLASRINFYSVIGFSLIIGVASNAVAGTILSLLSVILLRRLTGGVHAKTLTGCLLFSVAVCSGIPHVSLSNAVIQYINLISIVLVLKFSEHDRYSKYTAIMLISSNFLLNSSVVSLSFFVQSLSLIKLIEGGDKNTMKKIIARIISKFAVIRSTKEFWGRPQDQKKESENGNL
ncbi:accessory gene regulator B family protein [Paenibacillus elgii]|uniref:accessory gene regulator B family protein n=1 Tax=Paenibacillus elgii TaxID=189691 RepID=UPI000248D3A5|nr:accessory gene regulator B family protein [Paenibacillus elgii]